MPKITDIRTEGGEGALGRWHAQLLSDSGGLTQFGAFVETLWPGARSARNHWHRNEDEMVYMLEGEATLVEGDAAVALLPGEAATFRAGVPVGHHIENRTASPVRYLVIGTRSGDDVVTFPDTGATLTIRDGERIHRDASGVVTDRKSCHGA